MNRFQISTGRPGWCGIPRVMAALAAVLITMPAVVSAQEDEPRRISFGESLGVGSYWLGGVSNDGRTVLGVAAPQFQGVQYVRWVDGVPERFSPGFGGSFGDSQILAVNANATIAVGTVQGGHDVQGWVLDGSELVRLGFIGPPARQISRAYDLTPGGRLIVGDSAYTQHFEPFRYRPVIWEDRNIRALPTLPGSHDGGAHLISADGTRIAGTARADGPAQMVIWDGELVRGVGMPSPDSSYLTPIDMTDDGSWVVGRTRIGTRWQGFRWSDAGYEMLPPLPGGSLESWPMGMSGDGSAIVGWATQAPGPYCKGDCPGVRRYFIWTPETGTRVLSEYLRHGCGYVIPSWSATGGGPAISQNGRFVAFPGAERIRQPTLAVAEIGALCDPDYVVPDDRAVPGDLFVANARDGSIIRINAETGEQRYVSQGGLLEGPGTLIQSIGRELIVRSSPNIVAVDIDTGDQRLLAQVSRVAALVMAPDGRLFATTNETFRDPTHIVEVDLETGGTRMVVESIDDGSGFYQRFALGTDGFLYFKRSVDREPEILRIDPDTGMVERFTDEAIPEFRNLTPTPEGELVGVEYTSGYPIHVFDTETGDRRIIRPQLDREGLFGIIADEMSIDSKGRLLAANFLSRWVSWTDLETGESEVIAQYGLMTGPGHVIEYKSVCNNGIDDDGDGNVDAAKDPGCDGLDGDTELHLDAAFDLKGLGRKKPSKPGPGSEQRPYVVLTLAGTDDFDVRDLDLESLRLGPGRATPAFELGTYKVDVDRDGRLDLKLAFVTGEAALTPDDAEGCLRGTTREGVVVAGCGHYEP